MVKECQGWLAASTNEEGRERFSPGASGESKALLACELGP